MKKLFTLIAAAMMAVGVQAQTLINYPSSQDGIKSNDASVTFDQVKIYTNTTNVPGIKFGSSYTSDNKYNGKSAELTVEGGFKAGDVITIAGAFNNSDNTKLSAVDIFTLTGDVPEVLFTTKQFINGRLVNDDPVEETFTLTADVEKLYIGRNGNTGTFVTTLKVVRGEEKPSDPTAAMVWDFQNELSAADAANLAADAAKWTYDADNGYWKNTVALAERNVYAALTANNQELELTKGLTFTRDNSEGLGADRIRIAPAKYFAVNGSKVMISLGNLVKDDIIRLIIKGSGESERTLSVVNAEVTEGSLTTADTEMHAVTLKVLKDNVVSFTTSNGFQFFAISINSEITTGIQGVKYPNVENAAIYNLAGQKVAADYKGIAIKNGKKVVLK